ncbi:alpha/beta fold hydrolase [Actinoplanes sp. NPDC048791]|uniref:alpha/beta fold hydrolase n=1 Tax=Actinoplanes sp. NPDC048791 TaxID=3154623 RepID=UPI0033E93F83
MAYPTTVTVLAATLTAAGIGASWQAIASRRDRRRFPPPGELIDVGDHRLHLVVSGEPGDVPTVVLESGMASMSANWAWVRRELAQTRRVVSYDRAGLGWSDRATGPMDAATSAADLHAVLGAAGIGPPYVLAGHSYGGLVVRMFADRYRDEVAGIVLVDSSHPDQWVTIPAAREGRTVATANRLTALSARFGLLRLLRTERPFIAGLPAREYAEMRAYLARPQGWAAGAEGLIAWARTSREQVDATRDLGDLPLVVLSVTEQNRYAEVLSRLQAELPALSSNSEHLTVAGASHYTLVSERTFAAIVADAVRVVSAAALSGGQVRRPAPVA